MLNVYIADLTGLEAFYDEKVRLLHTERADKLQAYKMSADRIRSLGAGLLLEKGLIDYMSADKEVNDCANFDAASRETLNFPRDEEGRYIIHYGYGPQGKPFFKDYPGVYFSLSHSGDLAVLALSDSEVGIDVQEHRGYSEKIAKRFYHEKEIKLLETVSEPEKKEILFYKMWTGKEAYIKYTGKGMREALSRFYRNFDDGLIYDDVNTAKVFDVPLKRHDYQCSVVSAVNTIKIDKIIKINL